MIRNGMKFVDPPHANRLHGIPVTLAQIEALEMWRTFEFVNGYPPLMAELSRITSTHPSSVRRWMQGWEESGVIKRGKGLREYSITEKGHRLIAELKYLQGLWELYIDKREALIRDFPKITASG